MPDVPQVIRELLGRTDAIGCVAAPVLRPSRQPGLYEEPPIPVRDALFEHPDELGPLRPGADDGHLAADGVPQLRKLVEPRPPQNSPDSRDPRIAFGSPAGLPARLTGRDHRPELVHLERLATLAEARLLE